MANVTDLRNKVHNSLKEKEFDLNKDDSKEIVDTIFDDILELLVQDGEVPLGDLGKLQVVERKARKGRNPQTGDEIEIPAKNAPKFNPSKRTKEAVL